MGYKKTGHFKDEAARGTKGKRKSYLTFTSFQAMVLVVVCNSNWYTPLASASILLLATGPIGPALIKRFVEFS